VRGVLGRVEALEGKPAAPGLDLADAELGEPLRPPHRDRPVGVGLERPAGQQIAIERDAERAREVVVARARRPAALVRRCRPGAGDPIEQRQHRLQRCGQRVGRPAALARDIDDARLAQLAQRRRDVGQRRVELEREPRDRRRAAVAETVDDPQPQRVREGLEHRDAGVAHDRNAASSAASRSGASSAMWWPDSIDTPRRGASIHERQTATGSP
jgi:hypothetical protein